MDIIDIAMAKKLAGGGGGGSSLPSVTSADAGKVLAVNASGEWAAEQKIFYLIYDEDEEKFNLTPREAIALFGAGVLIAEINGYMNPDNPQSTMNGTCRIYSSINYNNDEQKYALYDVKDMFIVADDLDSPFYEG